MIVKPNPIDFDRVVVEFMLLHDTGNIAVIVTVSMIFLLYLIVFVVARKADKRDQKNVSIFDDVMKSGRFGNNGGVREVAEGDRGLVQGDQRVVEGGHGVIEGDIGYLWIGVEEKMVHWLSIRLECIQFLRKANLSGI